MRWMLLGVVVGTGCTGGTGGGGPSGSDTGIDTDGDTGVAACPVAVHLDAFACLESTGALPVDTGGYGSDATGSVEATVSELGAPGTLAGSAPVGGFSACDGAERVIRMVDGAGATWTVGWAVEGTADALPDSLAVGAPVTLAYEWVFSGYDVDRNLVISDAGGPRFVFAGSGVDPALLDGLAVSFGWQDTCTSEVDGTLFDETPVTFEGENTLVLYSGQSGTVDLVDRQLDVIVPTSAWMQGCADGCGTNEWVGWD
jgi:hypothetical protein